MRNLEERGLNSVKFQRAEPSAIYVSLYRTLSTPYQDTQNKRITKSKKEGGKKLYMAMSGMRQRTSTRHSPRASVHQQAFGFPCVPPAIERGPKRERKKNVVLNKNHAGPPLLRRCRTCYSERGANGRNSERRGGKA